VKSVAFNKEQQAHIDRLLQLPLDAEIWGSTEVDYLRSHIKKHYVAEQLFKCCYCQQQNLSTHGRVWDVEHVMPQSSHRDYTFEPQNLAVACPECNNKKSDEPVTSKTHSRFPRKGADYRIVHPHFDRYEDHIEIEPDLSFKPITGKGAFTIFACGLTRFKDRYPARRKPIQDKRFQKAIDELRYVDSEEDAVPIWASILAKIKLHSAKRNGGSSG